MDGPATGTADPFRIAIVGGGTAGWMAAAVCARVLPRHLYRVTLIESDAIGTVGVGEATIPQIQLVNAVLGIDEDAFVRATSATYKLGIEFAGWGDPGSRYIHAFGETGRPAGRTPFHHLWLRGLRLDETAPLDAYSLNAVAAYAGRFAKGPSSQSRTLGGLVHAFHFDAGLYAQFLRRHAEAHGAVRIEGIVRQVDRNPENGDVKRLVLADGGAIAADLFLDCSGFRGLLIEETLQTGYVDWTHWLPCDRALAVGSAPTLPILPYTRATAKEAGWQWRIPLQTRIGNGHVYCSAQIGDDEAAATLLAGLDGPPLGEPRLLRFTTGRRRAFWNRNVVAMGLAAGFMEPLESTSIHLVQSAIERVIAFLPRGPIRSADVAEYNAQTIVEWERVRDFLILHYHANRRPEPFWRACRDAAIPDTLAEKIALFCANGRIVRGGGDLFSEPGWLQVMVGQGMVPQGYAPLADAPSDAELREFLQLIRTATARHVDTLPPHATTLARLG